MFKIWEREALRLLEAGLVMPGYDAVIKCSHLFNVLDARGAISVSERVGYIARVRKLARRAAEAWERQRLSDGFRLIPDAQDRARWIATYIEPTEEDKK
jgi:glycyl-tRNA synthetase alpha chain